LKGLVDVKDPNAKVKFLAAEALRGVGGLLLTADGERFADELGHRDYVTGQMWKHKGPFRLVLNSKAGNEIAWHCKVYNFSFSSQALYGSWSHEALQKCR
jgi:succinate dehydrogenase/fumarate reductase flavoprotein subunit